MTKKNIIFYFILIIITWILSFYGVNVLSSIGLLSVIYVGNKFLNELGSTIPILELILFVSGFQWIIGPFILYRVEPNMMYVPEEEYMLITVLAYLSFIAGCLFFNKQKAVLNKAKIVDVMTRPRLVYLIKFIYWLGLICFLIPLLIQTPLDFVFTTIYNFSFIAALMLLYSSTHNKKFYAIFIYSLLFLKGAYLAVFAEFILQCFLLIIFIPNIYSLSKKKIIILMSLGIIMLSAINTAKAVYREKVWSDSTREVNIGLFFSGLFNSEKSSNDGDNAFLSRISSGAVNSYIFSYVPRNLQHTNGEVLVEDFVNALIPRFLYPDKKDIDSRKNYMMYTGRYLDEKTSVGINALGIGYAEFGIVGCFIFMFTYGLLLKKILVFFISHSHKNILYLFSIIVVFISSTKAESEFVSSLNGLLKTMLFVVFLIYLISKNKSYLLRYEK